VVLVSVLELEEEEGKKNQEVVIRESSQPGATKEFE